MVVLMFEFTSCRHVVQEIVFNYVSLDNDRTVEHLKVDKD
jgi:hypothetical protein